MATLYLNIPEADPTTVTVSQASTLNGTRTTVIDAVPYGSFSTENNYLVITDAGLDADKYSFVIYTYRAYLLL